MNIMNRFTLQTLYKNKLRTLVTIIGIILFAIPTILGFLMQIATAFV